MNGTTITRPPPSRARSVGARSHSTISPSYSSPTFPPLHNTLRPPPPGAARGAPQSRQHDGPFVLTAMVAAGEQARRPRAVANHGDRNHHRAPCGSIVRMRQFEKAVLLAVGVEIDRRRDGGRAHAHYSLTNRRRGVLQKVSTPVSVIRMLSVISSP